MAYTVTSQVSRLVNSLPGKAEVVVGIDPLSGGTLTKTVKQLKRVDGCIPAAQSANAVYVSATATNTFTLTGTGSDVIMWIAWGQPRL